ncbi:uncharacterized protein LOC115878431 [Sitophilus oryzae]|uniref:Uncharacterized protein LOC115878431 n=1 Tax=Sitophilus oryzae TaxID=7048 RepID=A0A6J2XIQ7_SITOR|nr:uncharacterized protein LOC115878431 [Sitophilus oryzae]
MLRFIDIEFISAERKVKQSYRIYQLVDGCPEAKGLKLPMQLKNVKIELKNNTYKIFFDVVINEDIPEDFKSEFQIMKCKDKGSLDSCEKYHKIPIPYTCKLLNANGPWLSYVQAMKPPLECPLKKGAYKLSQGISADVQEMAKLHFVDGNFFRNSIMCFGQKSNKLIFCASNEIQLA